MKSFALMVLLTALVATGCKKKQQPAPADNTPAPAPAPAPVVNNPNPPPNAGSPGGANNNNTVGVIPTAAGGGVVTNVGGGGGSGGAAQAVRKAARRANALNEMKNIGEIIETMRDEFGKMPTKDAIVNEMKKYPALNTGITEGAYIITGTTEGGGLWAYEVDSENVGGILVIGGRATRANADEAKQYLRR